MGRLVPVSPWGLHQAEGRQPKVDARIVAAAIELAAIAKQIGSGLMSRSSTSICEYGSTCRDKIVRMLALAASIEGMVGDSQPVSMDGCVFLDSLSSGGIYVTHLSGGDIQWTFVANGSPAGMIIVDIDEGRVARSAAEWGLCPYGVTTGAWSQEAWTECSGIKVGDGKDVLKAVDAESEGMELPEFEGEG